jgi:predicted anti-sigma-YlaC factor YlaD
MRTPHPTLAALLVSLALAGCRGPALSIVASAVSETGSTYASDDDPELVRAAVPFGLKTMEGLLESQPRHVKLLTALAANFTQYTFGFVHVDAEDADRDGKLQAARAGRERARRLFLRARDYGLRGLEVKRAGIAARLASGREPAVALRITRKDDVELLYWTAAAWTLAISDGKGEMALVAELPVPVAMMQRALELDPDWNEGTLHEFFVTFDATRSAAQGGGPERARAHLERALALSMNKKLGPLVSWAEGVLVMQQDRAEFTRILEAVLRADPGAEPRYRLANLLAQRRARALLDHTDDLFL